MKTLRLLFITLVFLLGILKVFAEPVEFNNNDDNERGVLMEKTNAQPQLFYRGDMDDSVVAVENGARVNEAYADFVRNGPWAEVTTWAVTPRINAIVGYGMANYTFIEGETGYIMIDTGQNVGAGYEALKMKDAFSSKPVVAIIYTHFHYTRGTQAVVQRYHELDIPVYGHPDVDENMRDMLSYLAPGRLRRGAMQFGFHLPKEGADAEYSISEPHFEDASLNAQGHMPVTHPVADGEKINIDGLDVVFHHAVADTEDSLIIHFPDLDAVVHNTAVMPFMFPMYTLRGDFDRSVPEVLHSIDKLREINPKHLLGCHGNPISGYEKVNRLITAHRDALAYIYQQTVRGINQGLAPDAIVRQVRLPAQLTKAPELFPAYVDVEYMVRGVYRGLIGWWANDTADLHPPEVAELGGEIVQGFGGAEALLQRVEHVLKEKRYNLAAKLAAYALADDPSNQRARSLKAAALRKMAYATPTGIQTRNFLLHEALLLEGKITPPDSRSSGIIPLSVDMIIAMPPAIFLETLSYSIDGGRAGNLVATVKIDITDIDEIYTLSIRNGATEFIESAPVSHDLSLALDLRSWAELFLGHKRLAELIEESKVTFTGEEPLKESFVNAYHDVF